jgi:manganese/zinc/iron transport system ATP- binding protein
MRGISSTACSSPVLSLARAVDSNQAELAIQVRGLGLGDGREIVLSRASLSVPSGAFGVLLGPPGAGKTTLLAALSGRLSPRSGEASLFGAPIRQARADVALVRPEDPIDWQLPISVAEAVSLGSPGAPATRAGALRAVGLDRLASRRIADLDLLQRRLTLLGRAVGRGARLLLLDEPFLGLRAEDELSLLELLRARQAAGATVLVATRGLAAVVERYDYAALLNGAVVAEGRPAEILTRANLARAYAGQPVPAKVDATRFAVDA